MSPDEQEKQFALEHLFVVGLPRTGTKLVKVITVKAEDKCFRLSDESWFFGDLFRSGIRKQIRKIGDMRNDDNVSRLVEFLFSGKFKRSYWLLVARPNSGFVQSEYVAELLQTDRSDRAIYEAILRIYASRDATWRSSMHKVIGDKTPGHLYFVPQTLEWFPDAKIIHTFRDPRAIVASELKKIVDKRDESGQSRIARAFRTVVVVMYITVTWLYARRLHYRYLKDYPDNYYLSRYEDLVSEPEVNVEKLCSFMGVSVEPAMFAPRLADSSFSNNKKQQGFNAENLDRWRDYLKPWITRWFNLWTGRYLHEFGYRR